MGGGAGGGGRWFGGTKGGRAAIKAELKLQAKRAAKNKSANKSKTKNAQAELIIRNARLTKRRNLKGSSVNAQKPLNKKLSTIENLEKNAVKTKVLSDGRIRYYRKEKLSETSGPTRGSAFVTEYAPKTGRVRQWLESYDHSGRVNRVHPKSVNGYKVDSQHYPPTGRELEKK